MNNLRPKVSIIIPTYNNVRYIGQAVASALVQTYPSFEVIVIDDGSTDGTREVLSIWRNRIRYVWQENQGVSAARNHGLRLARGEYIVFLDGDDLLRPSKLALQADVLDAEPDVSVVHSGWRRMADDGRFLETICPWENAPNLDLKSWLLWKPAFLGAMMFRRRQLVEIGGFDESLRQAEDVDLMLRLAARHCRMVWVREPTIYYRIRPGSTMSNGREQAASILAVLDKFFDGEEIPVEIQNMRHRIYFHTLMWAVWQLYLTDYLEDIPRYLQRTLAEAVVSPSLAMYHWLVQLARYAVQNGRSVGELRVLWPYFQAALGYDDAHWQRLEPVLDWWVGVWWHYLQPETAELRPDFPLYTALPPRRIIELARSAILMNPSVVTLERVQRLWHDLVHRGIVPAAHACEVITLYLTLFGQSLRHRRWRHAWQAFKAAMWASGRPNAWRNWLAFFTESLAWLWDDKQMRLEIEK